MRLLFEIGMEENPARFLKGALQDLKNNLEKKFGENRIKYNAVKTYGTPRRLIIEVEGIATVQEDLNLLNMGPAKSVAFAPSGEISRAGLGFLKSQGVEMDGFEIVDTPKGEYIAVKKFMKGRETSELLPEILKSLVLELSFPRTMRWSDKSLKFARPVKWFLALLNNDVVEFEIEGIKSGRESRGHRFFGSDFTAQTIDDYFEKVRKNNVIIDIEERKNLILKLIDENCVGENERVHVEKELLDEVTNLVEYPFPIVGTFNSEFLEVPQEVLIISMQVHQRYFPILDMDGKLQPKFVVVRNGVEFSEQVKKGNEKVISARLSDARFFYNEDLKNPLENNIEKLKTVVYQKDLGTIYQKIERSKVIAEKLIPMLGMEDKKENIVRCIELSKADLVSNMIGEKEFTKLQGFMGADYALKFKENKDVALGIAEHYYPRFPGDILPTTCEGIVTSICDRIDTLVGCFAVGLIPTGSKDPFALRRATQGIVSIILNSNLEICIPELVNIALDSLEAKELLKRDRDDIFKDVVEFVRQRAINSFNEMGHRKDIIISVLDHEFNTLTDARIKIVALEEYSQNENFEKFIQVLKRVGNISKDAGDTEFNEELLVTDAEKELSNFIKEFDSKIQENLKEKNYTAYINNVVSSIPLVDRYFEEVMIMDRDENIKNNRLAQLKMLDSLYSKLANLKLVEA
ncbi:MAG: glycine--tRNA ligase subunit beta [Fusobacteriaceae bacterium]